MNDVETAVDSIAVAAGRRGDRFAEWPGLAAVFAQVLLVAAVMRIAAIETLGFRRIVYLAACGFVVHHFLSPRHRLRFFLALSIAGMVIAFGGSADSRLWDPVLGLSRSCLICGIGVALIALCHLRVRAWKRATLLALAGLFIAIFRSGRWDSRILAVVWPVLAALFMFRIIVYLHDLSASRVRPTRTQSMAYFFLLPNYCALLFPVIDFRTFCQKYYDEEALVIYQRGVKWMTRGLIHLLLYRVAHKLFLLEAADIKNGTDLIQFVVANVFLYLKVSGSFHLFVGMLLLFGFNLPETNHRYFLASSFTDYWRRVNTYWRAFIMKVFYYPMFFRLRKRGQVTAMVVAVLWCFAVTWALHLYQTWWVKGAVALTCTDALFWGTLALLVLANSLWEWKRSGKKKLAPGGRKLREAIGLVARTALTFAVITFLWSLWCTPSIGLWLHIWSLADLNTLAWGCAVVACVTIATVFLEILPTRGSRSSLRPPVGAGARAIAFRRDAVLCAATLVAILAVGNLAARSWAGLKSFERPSTATEVARLVLGGMAYWQGSGYYENLTAVDESTSQYWETMTTTLFFMNQAVVTNDSNVHELTPNIHLERNGLWLDTNRWGMRDREHDLMKPPATLRMAFLGSSHVMGYGIPMRDTFGAALADRLNKEHPGDGAFEVFNFAVNSQSPLGQIWMLHNRAIAFHPDLVLFVAHLVDFEWVARDVVADVHMHKALPAGFPMQLLTHAGVTDRTFEVFAMQRLRPSEPQMLAYCYGEIVRQSRSINALPVCVFLPLPMDLPLDSAKAAYLLGIARDAGFTTIDLSDIFADYKPKDLMLPESSWHSNAKAHAIIAAALYNQLISDPRIDVISRVRRIRSGFEGERVAK